MYLSGIEIENIRGFRSGDLRIKLELQRPDGRYAGWTVVAGRNGTGKSSFLKAIALAIVGPPALRALQQSMAGWMHSGEWKARVRTSLVADPQRDRFGKEGYPPNFRAAFQLDRLEEGPEPALTFLSGMVFDPGQQPPTDSRVTEIGPWAVNPQGWFLAGYGPYRRLTSALDSQRPTSGLPQFARLASLFREDVPLTESIQWLKEHHLRRLERRTGAGDLVASVLKLLNSSMLPDSTRVVDVDSEGLWVEQKGVRLPLTEMSDGFRTTTALVLDLCRQLHATYQELELVEQAERCWVPYPGVVLIDEVELHLHVSWQQRIGFWLKEHFPNIQFIVTTHSPFVCQAADPKGLIRLPAPGEERTAEHVSDELYRTVVNGTVDEAVLTELFGLEHVHSNQSERLRRRVADLEVRVLDGKASPEEREELERLAAQLPNTGSALVDRAVRKFRLDE